MTTDRTFTAQELRARAGEAELNARLATADGDHAVVIGYYTRDAAMLRYAAQMRERLDGLKLLRDAWFGVANGVGPSDRNRLVDEAVRQYAGFVAADVDAILDAAPVPGPSAPIDPERKGPRG